MSEVWNYFMEISENGTKKGRCLKCSKLISCSKNSTSGMSNHLRVCRKIDLEKQKQVNKEKTSKKLKIVDKKNNAERLSKLMSCDGFTAHAIVKLETLQELFLANGTQLPSSSDTVFAMVEKVYEEKKQLMKEEIKMKLKAQKKFEVW